MKLAAKVQHRDFRKTTYLRFSFISPLILNIQRIAASSRSSQRTYVLGSLMATRNISQVYPYKLAGHDFPKSTTMFNLFAGYYDLNTIVLLLRHFTWRIFYRTFMLFPSAF